MVEGDRLMLKTIIELLPILIVAIPAVAIGFLLGAEPKANCEEDTEHPTIGSGQDIPIHLRWWCAWKKAKLPLSLPTILTVLILLASVIPSAFDAAGIAQIEQSQGQNLLLAKLPPTYADVAATQPGTPIPEPAVVYPPVVDTPQPDVQQPSVIDTPQQVSVSPTPSEELIIEVPSQLTPEVNVGLVALTVTVDLTSTLEPDVPPDDLVDTSVITPANSIASIIPARRIESPLPLTDHECDQSTPGVLALLSPVRNDELTCRQLANGGYAIQGRVPSKYIWYEVQYALTDLKIAS